jgi:hypothetical protein
MRTALRCPMCGTMNPVGNVYCDQCHARLIPMAAPPPEEPAPEQAPIRGLSLPTIPLEKEEKEEEEQQVERLAEGAGPAEGEAEDWLTQLRASAVGEAEEPEAAGEPVEPVEIPDWLRDMGPVGVEMAAPPSEEQPLAEAPVEEQAPTMPPPAVTEVAEPFQEPAPAEIPDWLRELAPPEAAAPEAAPEEGIPKPPPPAPAEIPAWLRELAPPEAAAPEVAPEEVIPTPPPLAPAEAPGWLREIVPPEAAAPEVAPEEEILAPPPPAPAEAPDWLREIVPPEAAAPEVAPEEAIPTLPPLAPAEVPDWLREIVPPEAAAPEVAPEEAIPTLPPLAPAKIPDWLREAAPPEAVAEEEPVETEGVLEGLRGVLAPAPVVKVPGVRESTLPSEISKASLARAQLLQSLLTRPPEVPQLRERRRGIRMAERIQRWLVAAVLLIAVGGILMAPLMTPNAPTFTQPVTSPGVTRLYDTIQGLRAGDDVLVAFEYGPTEADELNPVAQTLLQHMLNQGAHISIASTRPEGLAAAERSLSAIGAPEGQYTLHGYRPGDATGVSHLLADAGTPPRLVLVLTAQPGPLRWWVEQTHARGEAAPSIVAGLSAALEPSASPYLDISAGQIEGALVGLSGAAAYERLRGSAEQATQRLDALAAGHVAIVGLMILGAVFHTFGGLRGRGK